MMVGWSDGGAPSAQAVPSDADAVTGAQRDPTQLDLTSHIRSRIKRRGLGKWSACACAVVSSPSRSCLTREYREQGESDAKGWTGSAGSEREREREGETVTEGRKAEKKSGGKTGRSFRFSFDDRTKREQTKGEGGTGNRG